MHISPLFFPPKMELAPAASNISYGFLLLFKNPFQTILNYFTSSVNKTLLHEEQHTNHSWCNEIERGQIKMVMDRLGIEYDDELDTKSHKLTVGVNEFSSLFDEDEPSLEEVNGAFDVFDKNGDGFIDATELREVLCSLGLRRKEELELEECSRMISEVDQNGDEVLGFDDFVKFIEKCF